MNNIDTSLHYLSLLKKEFPDKTILQLIYDSIDFVNPTGSMMVHTGKVKRRNIPITDSYIEKCLETRLAIRMRDNNKYNDK